MALRIACLTLALLIPLALSPAAAEQSLSADTLKSVVSVLPVRPEQEPASAPPGVAPEGSGIVVRPGLVATAWHVVEGARRIDIHTADGRVLPAHLMAWDEASDIALLGVDARLPPIEIAPQPGLAQPVCAIGNAYGLGLSVTCGVVSALNVTDTGFNAVEDFIQTDAATNPGSSGGALVDRNGRLVGMMSAIFASGGDTNIGINFAVSAPLLLRVVDALAADGEILYPSPGWQLESAGREQLATLAAPVVREVKEGSPADAAGIAPGDLILQIGPRRIRTPRDSVAALAVLSGADAPLAVGLQRGGQSRKATLPPHATPAAAVAPAEPAPSGDCPHPAPVCLTRQAVFPISSFDPVGSATRIGPTLLVTSRHVVADRQDAIVHTPAGGRRASVIPSAYPGDLVLLEALDLPADGFIPSLAEEVRRSGLFYAVGADIARQEVRVFDPGPLIAPPAEGAELGRLHVRAHMQPGVSGGALIDEHGDLVGIAAGGGEGRFEAIPVKGIRALLFMRASEDALQITGRLGSALSDCATRMVQWQANPAPDGAGIALRDACHAAMNPGQLLEAGRILARSGDLDGAVALHGLAAALVPNSINARISVLVSLQLSGRFDEMTDHARRLLSLAPEDLQVLRLAIQSGVWGGAPGLAEQAYQVLETVDPQQARAARRFIDSAPPAPVRR